METGGFPKTDTGSPATDKARVVVTTEAVVVVPTEFSSGVTGNNVGLVTGSVSADS